jgi:hypothetical protein
MLEKQGRKVPQFQNNIPEEEISDDPRNKVTIFKRGTKYPEILRNSFTVATSPTFCGTAAGELLLAYAGYKTDHF